MKQSDSDLIIALTDDYLNIYRTMPEEDTTDVIKLDGYITECIGENWNGLCYSKLLNTYTNNRVHPEDRENFLSTCCNENIIKMLSTKQMFHGKYRVLDENNETHYYNYKYVKVSAPNEPLRVVAAFRNVDDLEAKDQQRISQMEHFASVLSTTQMGTWNLYLKDGCKPRLDPDSRMKELMGIPEETKMTEEEYCEMLLSRIHPKDRHAFDTYSEQLTTGKRAECTYRWFHPTLGERYERCGGIAVMDNGVQKNNGYHYDVTEQMQKEMRTKRIVSSYVSSYEFINYILLDDDTFYTYTGKAIEDELIRKVLNAKTATEAINIGLKEIVADEFKKKLTSFSNIATMNKRMSNSNVISSEFKDIHDIWYESSFTVAERNADGTIKYLIWAMRQIDDEKQIELKKEQILEENIAANKAKTKFLQNMSHEIRTPLNALFGFAQLLGLPDGSWTEQEKAQYNSYIYNSYNMLDMLISDIIDIADDEHGNYRINLAEMEVNSVCRNAMMSVEFRVPADVKLYFTTDIDDNHIIVSDGRRIQQVLINYLTNACKNTLKGEIHLHCSSTEHPGKLTFSVTDTGKGVPKEKADVIFNRFTKLNQYVQGSGLGLNICQTIANKLDGEVYLDTSYTNGARFVFVVNDTVIGS